MTKRNKNKTKSIPIIIKCKCGEAIANAIEGSIGCINYPACCDDDYEFI